MSKSGAALGNEHNKYRRLWIQKRGGDWKYLGNIYSSLGRVIAICGLRCSLCLGSTSTE